jgi:hypothetical protein
VRTIADQAARQRPPLTKRLGPGQWSVLDYFVGAAVGVILFASIRKSVGRVAVFPHGAVRYQVLPPSWPLAMFLVAVAAIAVALRRRRPVLMLGVLLAGSVLVTTLTGPDGGSLIYFLPVAYVLYLVAATYERRQAAVRVIAAVLATLVANAVLLDLTGRGDFARGGLVSVGLCVIIAWSAGYTVRQRRRYAVRLQDEAASKATASTSSTPSPRTRVTLWELSRRPAGRPWTRCAGCLAPCARPMKQTRPPMLTAARRPRPVSRTRRARRCSPRRGWPTWTGCSCAPPAPASGWT